MLAARGSCSGGDFFTAVKTAHVSPMLQRLSFDGAGRRYQYELADAPHVRDGARGRVEDADVVCEDGVKREDADVAGDRNLDARDGDVFDELDGGSGA